MKRLLYFSGYYKIYSLFKHTPDNRLLIIMYHGIVADGQPCLELFRGGSQTQSQFHAHIKALGRRFRIIALEDAVLEIKREGKLRYPTACITFDDGCRSVYDLAFPALKKADVSATVYLPTDWINRLMIPWWILLKNVVFRWDIGERPAETVFKKIGLELNSLSGTYVDPGDLKRLVISKMESCLRAKSQSEIEQKLEEIMDVLGVDLSGALIGNDPMSWDQIGEMSKSGIHFGAHTRTHINLKYADIKTAETEIVESKKEIERRLGIPVTGFAYPYGTDVNEYKILEDVLRLNNFDYACTAAYGSNGHADNLYLLRRITLPQTRSKALLGRILILDYY